MPIVRPSIRHVAAACLAVASLLAIAGPVAALEPPRPLPGHRPAFVTETDEHPWKLVLQNIEPGTGRTQITATIGWP